MKTKKSNVARIKTPRLSPFFWFNNQAEAAVKFYTSIFKKSKILKVTRYGEAGAQVSGQTKGSVMLVEFKLEGQHFIALNGGPAFKFTEAISLVVNCQTQAEIDYFWKKLSAGGEPSHCGWLKDKYGLSWQIVPTTLGEIMSSPDATKTERVMQAILQMRKLDIKTLKQAYRSSAQSSAPARPK